MTDRISPKQFHESEGIEDWRVLGDGANAYFQTGSFAAGARLVQAISELPGFDDNRPEVDLRHDGVTVRMLEITDDYAGLPKGHVALARRISGVARKLGFSADPSAAQSLLVIPGATDRAAVMPFWRAVLGYEPRRDSPAEDLVDPHGRAVPFWFEQMKDPARVASAGSTSRYLCRMSRRRLASRRRWPRAAGWCATSSRRRGGRSPTRRATRPTSPRRGAATERVQSRGHATPRYLVVTRFVLPCIAPVMSSFRTDLETSSNSTSCLAVARGPGREVGRRSAISWALGHEH